MDEKINEYSEISILNRIRSIPGLIINGPDDNNAQVYVTGITSIKFTQEVTLPKAKSMVGLTVFFCIRYCKHPAPWRSLQNRLHVQRLVCPVVYLTTTL